MLLDQTILNNHSRLSKEYVTLVKRLIECNDENKHRIDLQRDDVPGSLKVYPYGVSPWAILLSQSMAEKFNFITRSFPNILKKCIVDAFTDQQEEFSKFIDLDPTVFELFVQLQAQLNYHYLRYDLLLKEGEIKLIEINSGTGFGGWELYGVRNQYEEIIHRASEKKVTLSFKNSTSMFFESLFDCIKNHCMGSNNNNVLLILDQTLDAECIIEEDREVFHQLKPNEKDHLYYTYDPKEIEVKKDGKVYFRNTRIAAILNTGVLMGNVSSITIAHLTRNVFFPDNPFYKLLGSKLHFALMYERATSDILSKAEQQLVQMYIPWSVHCYKGQEKIVSWNEENFSLKSVMEDHKNQLVIKAINESSGIGIYPGKYLGKSEWDKLMKMSFEDPHWLVQKFYEPDQLYAPTTNGDVVGHHAIWGIFGFCDRYAGGFVRLSHSENSEYKGVINAARGAREAIILEVKE